MTFVALIDETAERAQFEAFCRRGLRADEAERFLTRAHNGAYVLGTACAGWAAWKARAITSAEDILREAMDRPSATSEVALDVRLGIAHPAKLLRAIQIDAASLLSRFKEGSPEWEILADIHKTCCSALQLKPTTTTEQNGASS